MHDARLAWELSPTEKPNAPLPTVNIGCSGWFYWHWRGQFYPSDMPTSQWFRHYAKKFRTVELNAPFYSWPTVAAVRAWTKQVGKCQMIYTVKVSELITHVKRFSRTTELIRDFGHIADLLGPRMGCFLFQFPPSFQYSPGRLKRIIAHVDPSRRNVVEFRHPSWWNHRVFDAFRSVGVIFCSCSGPRLPDQLVKTAEEVYIRFHGVQRWYRHDYSRQELKVWKNRVEQSGVNRVWAYFNNDRDGYAIRNASAFKRLITRSMLSA